MATNEIYEPAIQILNNWGVPGPAPPQYYPSSGITFNGYHNFQMERQLSPPQPRLVLVGYNDAAAAINVPPDHVMNGPAVPLGNEIVPPANALSQGWQVARSDYFFPITDPLQGNNRSSPALVTMAEPEVGAGRAPFDSDDWRITHPPALVAPVADLVLLENWPGWLNFTVTPTPNPADGSNNAYYLPEDNKLFCRRNIFVPFRVRMDYSKVPMEKLPLYRLKAFLVYENETLANKPVLRCLNHKYVKDGSKMRTLENIEHFLQADRHGHVKVEHVRDPSSGRFCAITNLGLPDSGVDYLQRRFIFTCNNSCTPRMGRCSPQIAMVFQLLNEEGVVVGRSICHVRVCAVPSRDKNVKPRFEACPKTKTVSKPPAIRSARKRKNFDRDDAGDEENGESQQLSQVSSTTRDDDDDVVASSQESVYSDNDSLPGIRTRGLFKDIRTALRMKSSTNERCRSISRTVFYTLRVLETVTKDVRSMADASE